MVVGPSLSGECPVLKFSVRLFKSVASTHGHTPTHLTVYTRTHTHTHTHTARKDGPRGSGRRSAFDLANGALSACAGALLGVSRSRSQKRSNDFWHLLEDYMQ